jgi:hypothetical protein
LQQITKGGNCRMYGIELDAARAATAAAVGITTIQGSIFDTHSKVERFSLLYLNPPYDSEIGSLSNRRESREEEGGAGDEFEIPDLDGCISDIHRGSAREARRDPTQPAHSTCARRRPVWSVNQVPSPHVCAELHSNR